MSKVRITKRAIDALLDAPPGTVIRDEKLVGFRAKRNAGSVTYAFEYHESGRGGATKVVTIGRHGNITPDEARGLASKLAAEVVGGADPARTKAKERATPTIEAFATEWLDRMAAIAEASPENAKLRRRTIGNYRSLMKIHIGPVLGDMRLDQVRRQDVARLHSAMGDDKPMTANRVLELVGSLYRAAADAGHVEEGTNPARGVRAYKEQRRQRFLSAAELAKLGEAIRIAESSGLQRPSEAKPGKLAKHVPKQLPAYVIDAPSAGALRLLIFTGARLREILHAKWSDLDLERGLLSVWGKTGRRQIRLPAPALAVINALPRHGQYVIASRDPEKPKSDLTKPWRAVLKLAGLDGVRLHDLRHSFASVSVSGGASLPIIGALLGHSQAQTTMRYAHLADDPIKAASEKAASAIAAAMGEAAPATVAPIRRAGGKVR